MTVKYCHKMSKKHFKNEQRNRDDAAKKRANTSGVGKSRISIIIIPPYNNTLQLLLYIMHVSCMVWGLRG